MTENQLDADLQEDRAALSRLLAGLQAMQKQPAPAFAVHAEDALKAVQGALTVAAVVPHMESRADGLRDRLTELSAIRRRMDLQSEALLVAEQDAAVAARGDLDKALAEKKAAETSKKGAMQNAKPPPFKDWFGKRATCAIWPVSWASAIKQKCPLSQAVARLARTRPRTPAGARNIVNALWRPQRKRCRAKGHHHCRSSRRASHRAL